MARSELFEEQLRDADFLSEEEGNTISGSLQSQIDAKPDTFLELEDTPTTYSGLAGKRLTVKSDETGLKYITPSYDVFLQFTGNPTADGEIRVLAWYKEVDLGVSLTSASPYIPTNPGFGSDFVFDVSNVVGTPFTITVSGTIADHDTSELESFIDYITISGSAYYRTSERFIDAPTVSIVEASKSCNMDVYRVFSWDFHERDFLIHSLVVEFVPDQNNWTFDFLLCKHSSNGLKTPIVEFNFDSTDDVLRASLDEIGSYQKFVIDEFIYGSENEGISICITDQRAIGYFYIELFLESTHAYSSF